MFKLQLVVEQQIPPPKYDALFDQNVVPDIARSPARNMAPPALAVLLLNTQSTISLSLIIDFA